MIFNKNIVDFHSHILPQADHGSDSVETSLYQLNCARQLGISKIIATPHFYPHQHNVDDFIKRRDDAYMKLKPFLDDVKIKLGAEVLLYPGLENMQGIERLFVYHTKTLLLELPYSKLSDEHFRSVEVMIKQGINLVLAHPDRYSVEIIDKMVALGAKLQLNAASLVGFSKNKKTYFKWITSGAVVALGSDIHGKDKKAYKKLSKCYKILKNDAEIIIKESNSIWKEASVYTKNPTR